MKNFEILFNEISEALFLHDFEGNIIKVNNEACLRYGFSKEEFATLNARDFVKGDIATKWQDRANIIRKQGQLSFETNYYTKDNKLMYFEIKSKIIIINEKEFILTSSRDISERKNYEKQLKEARNIAEENEFELKTIFNKAPSTIIVFDDDSRILKINQKGILKFNVDEKNLVNQRIGDVLNCISALDGTVKCGFSERCLKCELAKVIRNTILLNKEYDKKEITIEILQNNIRVKKTMLVSTSSLKKNGKSTYLATIDDITSRKQMELELVAAKEKAEESEKLKTAFLNNISHEIRTPLNGILGFIHLLNNENYNFSKEEKKGFIEMVNKSGERLINTVTDLVEVSKLDSGVDVIAENEIDLYEKLLEFLDEYKAWIGNPEILFDFEIDPSLKNHIVLIDEIKLFQILKNLIKNAFKFTYKGKVKVTVTNNSSNIVFCVEDTGIGIDPKYKDCIYEPFRQIDQGLNRIQEGNGLGLTIAKKLVDKLGGNIWFESEIGKGTTFCFSCTLKTINSHAGIIETDPIKQKLLGKKILIAEDDILNYLFFEAVLSNHNCEIVHATNGKEAVEIFSGDPTFNIIIMDIKMPVMDGLEATCKIKAIRKEVPIIAYSAYVLNAEKQIALEAGCSDYLCKPAGKEQLLRTIEKHILPSGELKGNKPVVSIK